VPVRPRPADAPPGCLRSEHRWCSFHHKLPKSVLVLAVVIAMAVGHAAIAPSSARAACDEQSLFVWDRNHTSAATGAWNDADTANRVLDSCSGAQAVTTSQLGSPVPGDARQVEVGWQEYHGSSGHAWRMFFELQNGNMDAGNTLGALSCCIAYGWRVVYASGDGDFHFPVRPGRQQCLDRKGSVDGKFCELQSIE